MISGAGRNSLRQARLEHLLLGGFHVRVLEFTGPADVHGVVSGTPLHHVDALDRQKLVQMVYGGLPFDHERHHDVIQRLGVIRPGAVRHIPGASHGHPVDAAGLRRIRPHRSHALLRVRHGAAVGKEHALKNRRR